MRWMGKGNRWGDRQVDGQRKPLVGQTGGWAWTGLDGWVNGTRGWADRIDR
jgi:hypothetical protein